MYKLSRVIAAVRQSLHLQFPQRSLLSDNHNMISILEDVLMASFWGQKQFTLHGNIPAAAALSVQFSLCNVSLLSDSQA